MLTLYYLSLLSCDASVTIDLTSHLTIRAILRESAQLGNRPTAKKKVAIFLKFCFIFYEQTLKTDALNYNPLLSTNLFSAPSKDKSEIIRCHSL